MYKPIQNTIGFDLNGYRGAQRLREALRPYDNYREVQLELRYLTPRKERKDVK